MAVVVRFNTTIVRRDAVAARCTGGVVSFLASVKDSLHCFAADDHLIAAHSMGAPWYFPELNLTEGDDFCFASQFEDWTPSVPWLSAQRVSGLPVGWLFSAPSAYISDSKPGRLMRRWSVRSCPCCHKELGLTSAVAAVPFEEITRGPLAVVALDQVDEDGPWRLTCSHCGAQCQANQRGDVALL